MVFFLSAGDDWLRYTVGVAFNPLVTFLVVGAVFANTALDPTRFEQTLETISMPLFAFFFVLAGYHLHFGELSRLGFLGITYVVVRSLGKVYGVRFGVQRIAPDAKLDKNTGFAMLCQAGVAIGLGAFLTSHWDHPMAAQINIVIMASVVIYELIGPLLVKYTMRHAGEIKVISLLRPSISIVHSNDPGFFWMI